MRLQIAREVVQEHVKVCVLLTVQEHVEECVLMDVLLLVK
jgi:hypothetical protein